MKALIDKYGFEAMDQYYEYIVESMINGQRKQVTTLFNALIDDNKKEFLLYLTDHVETENNGNTIYYQLLKYCIELLY